MNNASPGYRLFEPHADYELLVGKQQNITLLLRHVSSRKHVDTWENNSNNFYNK